MTIINIHKWCFQWWLYCSLVRNDNNAEHDFHAIMNQRTPDFRQLQPNFTIQVVSSNANNRKDNNDLAGDDKRTVPTWPFGTPGLAAFPSDPCHPNNGHEQHEQPGVGDKQQWKLPATLKLTVTQGWKLSARTSRSQRPRISLFKGGASELLLLLVLETSWKSSSERV